LNTSASRSRSGKWPLEEGQTERSGITPPSGNLGEKFAWVLDGAFDVRIWFSQMNKVAVVLMLPLFCLAADTAALAEASNARLEGKCEVVADGQTWDCRLAGGDGNYRRTEECSPENRRPMDPIFSQVAKAKSSRLALKDIVSGQFEKGGLRSSLQWFACQGFFVQLDDQVFPPDTNPTHAVARTRMTISTRASGPEWAAEVAKWDDLQIREDIWIFSTTDLPTQVIVQVDFSRAGLVHEMTVSSSGK
jgi:hypothetical protein